MHTDDDTTERSVAPLDALGDEIDRAVLAAAAESTVTAAGLADSLDVSSTTIYRHLDRLVEQGLLETVTGPQDTGADATEYRTTAGALLVSIDDPGVSVEETGESELRAAASVVLDHVDVREVTLEDGELRTTLAADDAALRDLEAAYRASRE